jgi:hypothetical protein
VAAAEAVIMSERSPARRAKPGTDPVTRPKRSHSLSDADPKVLAATLQSNPDLAWELGSGLSISFLTERMSAKHKSRRKALDQQVASWRHDLRQPGDGPLEDLMIERLIASFLAACHAELLRAANLSLDITLESVSFWDGHVARTNAEFNKAAKTLATLRRLRLPAVRQLNIGQQQVNLSAETIDGAGGS